MIKGGMILGLYEQELLRELENIPKRYDTFVDLGPRMDIMALGFLLITFSGNHIVMR